MDEMKTILVFTKPQQKLKISLGGLKKLFRDRANVIISSNKKRLKSIPKR